MHLFGQAYNGPQTCIVRASKDAQRCVQDRDGSCTLEESLSKESAGGHRHLYRLGISCIVFKIQMGERLGYSANVLAKVAEVKDHALKAGYRPVSVLHKRGGSAGQKPQSVFETAGAGKAQGGTKLVQGWIYLLHWECGPQQLTHLEWFPEPEPLPARKRLRGRIAPADLS